MKIHVIALASLLTSSFAYAAPQDSQPKVNQSFYVSGFAGQSSYDLPTHKFGVNGDDDSDFSYKLIGGYKVNQYLAIEGGYANLGKINYTELQNVVLPAIPGHRFEDFTYQEYGTMSVDGLVFNVVATYPLTETLSLYAKGGVFMWDIEINGDFILSPTSPDISDHTFSKDFSEDGSDIFYGLGVAYQFSAIAIKAEYEMYDLDGHNVDVISLGVEYNF